MIYNTPQHLIRLALLGLLTIAPSLATMQHSTDEVLANKIFNSPKTAPLKTLWQLLKADSDNYQLTPQQLIIKKPIPIIGDVIHEPKTISNLGLTPEQYLAFLLFQTTTNATENMETVWQKIQQGICYFTTQALHFKKETTINKKIKCTNDSIPIHESRDITNYLLTEYAKRVALPPQSPISKKDTPTPPNHNVHQPQDNPPNKDSWYPWEHPKSSISTVILLSVLGLLYHTKNKKGKRKPKARHYQKNKISKH